MAARPEADASASTAGDECCRSPFATNHDGTLAGGLACFVTVNKNNPAGVPVRRVIAMAARYAGAGADPGPLLDGHESRLIEVAIKPMDGRALMLAVKRLRQRWDHEAKNRRHQPQHHQQFEHRKSQWVGWGWLWCHATMIAPAQDSRLSE